ncbi:NAD-dependent protein deacetylase sirtuin-2 [Folsomia candida]|uniref:NAD-dependent protein deacetylase sirtuin-2 n=1 Tax=Folsomia candida TaxID=158441 RepID=A0A226EID1_FOLCA|nr:NAD-dependent protein deacetylase sirtuin-2 [Folsomia candida]
MSDRKGENWPKEEGQQGRSPAEEDEAGPAAGSSSGSRRGSQLEKIQNFVTSAFNKLSFGSSKSKIFEESTIEGVASYMKSEKCKHVIVMAGKAKIHQNRFSHMTASWLPFESNIQFSRFQFLGLEQAFLLLLEFQIFEVLVADCTTTFNAFITFPILNLLHNKGYLLRHYTQNIDGLERIAGVPSGKIVEAHGSFHTSHCIKSSCHKEYTFEWMKEQITKGAVPKCSDCNSTVKPDVVFFGESLPPRFFSCAMTDFPQCDLLIIMGTSLVVQPFAYLVNQVSADTPRVLINREIVGTADQYEFLDLLQKFNTHSDFDAGAGSIFSKGLDFKSERNRDVAILGDCDDGVLRLAEALGWKNDLLKLQSQSKQAQIPNSPVSANVGSA